MISLYVSSIFVVVIFTVIWIKWNYKTKSVVKERSNDTACKALDRISTFTTWITSLSTAALAALGLLFNLHKIIEPNYSWLLVWGFYSLIFFGCSVFVATWLLCSLPSIQLRLSDTPDVKNDIYEMDMYESIRIKLKSVSIMVHTYFLLGILSFMFFIFTAMIPLHA